jgi:DNA replication licensing factor MCM7
MKNPEKTVAPIAPAIIKKYIAVARTFDPIVPCGDITNYIVEAYVQLRIQDFANTSTNFTQNDQTSMTARQLLSILRLRYVV